VGANVGDYAIEMSNIFAGSDFCIHCFEPSAITYQKLVANIKGFDKIILNNSALSETEMTADLFSDSELSGLASLYHRNLDHLGIAMDKKEKVQLTTIDNYCRVHHIDKIAFLKLDVEGHELSVLRGANEMLSRKSINFIQFEFGGCNIDSRTYFRDYYYLLNDDFIIYRIVADGLFPISGYKETDEIFTTVNYLAERR
jgi:FkbM family methyltransferase